MANDVGIEQMYMAGRQVIIKRTDGSLVYVTLTGGGAEVSYAPDDSHYPESVCMGRFPDGPFDRMA